MTNKIFFFSLAVVSVMGSCTSDDILTPNNTDKDVMDTIHVEVKNSSFEIKLSSEGSSNSLRTIFETNDDNPYFYTGDNGQYLGIFCLAYDKLSAKAPAVNWSHTDTNIQKYNVWLNNVEANILESDTNSPRFCWTTDGIENYNTYYYPMGNWYQYSLYGYYPQQPDSQVNFLTTDDGTQLVTVDFTLDALDEGKPVDVIWGRNILTPEQQESGAYSASYFHQQEHANEVVELKMKHMLTRFRFKAVAGDSNGEETVEDQEIEVLDVYVDGVPNKMTLILAQTGGPENAENAEGTISVHPTEQTTIFLADANEGEGTHYESASHSGMSKLVSGYRLLNSHTSDNPLYLGAKLVDGNPTDDGILLPPIADTSNGNTYWVNVVLRNKNGEVYECRMPIEQADPTEGFKAGTTYWVEIKVNARKHTEEV